MDRKPAAIENVHSGPVPTEIDRLEKEIAGYHEELMASVGELKRRLSESKSFPAQIRRHKVVIAASLVAAAFLIVPRLWRRKS